MRNKRNKLPKPLRLRIIIRLQNKYPPNRIIVIPLLQELILVTNRIPLYQVLKLREVRREERAAADFAGHGQDSEVRQI